MDFQLGFSLVFALMLALTGGLGLIVARRGAGDPVMMRAVARTFAGAYVVLLVISLTHFFLIPTICIGAIAAAFSIASIRRA